MQSRGRRGDRSLFVREHGLVVGAVGLVDGERRLGDIGRQRHFAAFLQRLVEHRAGKRKGERRLAALPFGLDRGVELTEKADAAFSAEAHDIADRKVLSRPYQGVPARAVEPLDQRRRDRRLVTATLRTRKSAAVQARRQDFCVVDDERIALPQQIRQIADSAVFEPGQIARAHHQEPRTIARRHRPQRDAVLG